MIAASAFVDYPSTPMVDLQHVPSTGSYLARTLLAAATMFRFGHADFLTSQSFWSGYGWLDTALPHGVVTALTVSTGAAFVVTLARIAGTRAARTGILYVFVFAGLVAAFVTTSFTVLHSRAGDVHGRYLLGIYIPVVVLCWRCLPDTIPEAHSPARAATQIACGLAVIAIHGVAFATILSRYFG
jgi:hypothetical protein